MRHRHPRSSATTIIRLVAKLALVLGVLVTTGLIDPRPSRAEVPSGFENSLIGIVDNPTDIDFTPEGRMLVTSQGGQIFMRIGTTLTQIGDLSGRLCDDFERGLLGITPDPAFTTNRYVYVFYTYDGGRDDCLKNSPGAEPWNRVSRFRLNANSTVDIGSERVLVDRMPSPNGNHNAGTVAFGPDGLLYIAIGEGGISSNARLRNVLTGKILRVDRNGVAPTSNPFYGTGAACRVDGRTDAARDCRETYAWGFRNPFKFAFDPIDGRLNINDVGQNTWEEIDRGQPGRDYGWNACEGNHDNGSTSGPCGSDQTAPIHEYGHGSCNSITGGTFMPPSSWPSGFDSRYFFSDYTCGRIWTLSPGGSVSVFASGLGAVTEVAFGPYGDEVALYYAEYGSSQIRRIVYTDGDNRAPVADASADPTFGPLALRVQFDGSGSGDPDGDPLTYRWDFGDGDTSTSRRPVHTYTEQGVYAVTLTVRDGEGGQDSDTVRILAGTARPTVEIVTPTVAERFIVGQQITLKGRARDSSGEPISSRNFTWEVLLHHDTHVHPLIPPTRGNDIVFTAPAPEDLAAAANSYLEIRLTARDGDGLGKRVSQRLDPRKVTTTFATSPSGLDLQIEGVNVGAPISITTWAGDTLRVTAPDQIGDDGNPYRYTGWTDGGRRTHDVVIPKANSTITATFGVLAGAEATLLSDARVREGSPDNNDGASTGLSVKGGGTGDYETLLRFRVSGVGGTIERAIVYLYAYDGTIDGPGIYRTSSGWSEGGVTWNNRPGPVGGQLDDAGLTARRSWVAYDVTSTITGDGSYSFLLRGSSSDAVSWYSREAGANRPRLIVSSTGAAGASVDEPAPTEVASPTAIPTETIEPTLEPTATATPAETPVVEPTAVPTETPVPTETAVPATPPAMPLPITDAFEADLAAWQTEGATLAPASGRDGSTAARLVAFGSAGVAGEAAYLYRQAGADTTELFLSAELALIGQDGQATQLLTAYGPDGVAIATIFSTGDGNLAIAYAETERAEPVVSITAGTWVGIELRVAIVGDGTARVDVWVDGTLARSDVIATAAVRVDAIQIGHRSTDRAFDLLVDNVAIDRSCTTSCPPSAPEPAAEAVTIEATATPAAIVEE